MHAFLVGRIEWDQWLLLKFITQLDTTVVEVRILNSCAAAA